MTKASANEMMVIHPDPTWMIVGVTFFGGGGALLIQQHQPIIGIVSVAMGALSFAVLLWMAFSPRSRLQLTPEGFTFGNIRRISFYRWSDVATFVPLRVGGHDRVRFTFSKEFTGEMKLRHINQDFGGSDRFLPTYYGMSADQLAKLLESWRSRYAHRAAS